MENRRIAYVAKRGMKKTTYIAKIGELCILRKGGIKE